MSRSNTLIQLALSHLCCSGPPAASSPALAGWAGSRRGARRDRAPPWAPAWMRARGLDASPRARPSLDLCTIAPPDTAPLTYTETKAPGIFGVPLRQSIVYANVAISLVDDHGKSYIYGYVPIVVAKCGVFLKEKGTYTCEVTLHNSGHHADA